MGYRWRYGGEIGRVRREGRYGREVEIGWSGVVP